MLKNSNKHKAMGGASDVIDHWLEKRWHVVVKYYKVAALQPCGLKLLCFGTFTSRTSSISVGNRRLHFRRPFHGLRHGDEQMAIDWFFKAYRRNQSSLCEIVLTTDPFSIGQIRSFHSNPFHSIPFHCHAKFPASPQKLILIYRVTGTKLRNGSALLYQRLNGCYTTVKSNQAM